MMRSTFGRFVFVLACAPAAVLQAQDPRPLTAGGTVSITREGDALRVAVHGPRAGLASLCLATESEVRILHASAALGEAVYSRSGERWVLTSTFEFKLRDARTGPPTAAERDAYFGAMGWVANSSHAGAPKREFTIRLTERTRFLGVTFFTTAEPMEVSHWPAEMSDDCRAAKIAQGYLPETAAFNPASWHRLQRD